MATLDDRLLPVFAAQHWLVATGDIEAAGGTGGMARARVQSGRWSLVDVNVFRLAGIPSSWQSRLLAPMSQLWISTLTARKSMSFGTSNWSNTPAATSWAVRPSTARMSSSRSSRPGSSSSYCFSQRASRAAW